MITSHLVRELAAECGFVLAGIAEIGPVPDFERFRSWANRGLAGEMRYLTDHRAQLRADPATLLPGARSVICVGMLSNGTENPDDTAKIARYAWGADYHSTFREKLEVLASKLLKHHYFEWRACVDTAPLLERSLAAAAGLGWIGRNTCLINQKLGSFCLLGELLTTLEIPADTPAPDRCGTCTQCIDACPTQAIVPCPDGGFELDARLCISYFTIELRGAIPEPERAQMGNNVFGCDICQDVCPWNRKAPRTEHRPPEVSLEEFAEMDEAKFRRMFRGTPVLRAKYRGFIRNVAVAMGNSGLKKFREPLRKLAESEDALIAEHARWALQHLKS